MEGSRMKNISDQIFEAFIVAASLLAITVIVFGGLERLLDGRAQAGPARGNHAVLAALKR